MITRDDAKDALLLGPVSAGHKHLGQGLIDIERGFKSLRPLFPIGIFHTDANGRCIYVNERWCEITGLSATEMTGDGWTRALHPDDRERLLDEWNQMVKRNAPFRSEYRFRRSDGGVTWVLGEAVADTGQDGQVTGYVGAITDITDHKLIEEALASSQQRFRAIFDNALDAILLTDDTSRFVDANPAACALLGYTREELLRLLVRDVIPAENLELFRDLARDFFAVGKQCGEYALVGKNGAALVAGYCAVANIVPGLHMSIVRDITEHKRADQRLTTQYAVTRVLAEAQTAAEAFPKILQAAVESVGWDFGALWELDRDANALRCMHFWHPRSVNVGEFENKTRELTFAKGIGLPGRIWSSGKPLWIPDVVKDDNFPRAPYAAKAGLHTAIAFPIFVSGEITGVIEFFHREIHQPDAELLQMFSAIGNQIGQFTERKRAEQALESQTRILESVLDSMSDGVIVADENARFLLWNAAAKRIVGIGPVESPPAEWPQTYGIYLPDTVTPFPADKLTLTRAIRGEASDQVEMFVRNPAVPNGVWLSVSGRPLKDKAQALKGGVIVLRDVTERKHAEQALEQARADLEIRVKERTAELNKTNEKLRMEVAEREQTEEALRGSEARLRQLSAHMVSAREEESTRIAREVHDELGGTLTALKLGLTSLRNETKDSNSAHKKVGDLIALANTAMQTIKKISGDLRPSMLDTLGLVETIKSHAKEFSRLTGIRCELELPKSLRLSRERCTAVYRVIQESLTNVARHSEATEVRIEMKKQQGSLIVEIKDNGKGITEAGLSKSGSFGIFGMRERCEYLGGDVTVYGFPGKGSTVLMTLSLTGKRARGSHG